MTVVIEGQVTNPDYTTVTSLLSIPLKIIYPNKGAPYFAIDLPNILEVEMGKEFDFTFPKISDPDKDDKAFMESFDLGSTDRFV